MASFCGTVRPRARAVARRFRYKSTALRWRCCSSRRDSPVSIVPGHPLCLAQKAPRKQPASSDSDKRTPKWGSFRLIQNGLASTKRTPRRRKQDRMRDFMNFATLVEIVTIQITGLMMRIPYEHPSSHPPGRSYSGNHHGRRRRHKALSAHKREGQTRCAPRWQISAR